MAGLDFTSDFAILDMRNGRNKLAKHAEVLRECQSALVMVISPGSIGQTTVANAFAAATAAEARAHLAAPLRAIKYSRHDDR